MELYLCRRLNEDDSCGDEKQWVRFPTDGLITVGRSVNCGLRLSSIHISRKHATLKRATNEFLVRDQNSLTGIHVNGYKISPESWHTLKAGDEIEFGRPETGNTSESIKLDDRFVYLVKQATSDVLDDKPRGPSCHGPGGIIKVHPSSLKRKLAPIAKTVLLHGNVKKLSDDSATSQEQESDILRKHKRLKLVLTEKEIALESVRLSSNSSKTENPKNTADVQKDYATKVEQSKILNPDSFADSSALGKMTKERCDQEKSIKNRNEGMVKRKPHIESIADISTSESNVKIVIYGDKSNKSKSREIKTMEEENERLKLELERKKQELKKEINIREQKLEEEQKKVTEELENDFKRRYERREEELETRLMLEKDIAIEECEAKIQEKEKATTSIESVVNTMENELQCSICSELFIVSTTLNCAHTFCQYCIMEWRAIRDICPVCRKPIETVTRSLVLDNYIDKVLENLSKERQEVRKKLIEERKQLVKDKINSGDLLSSRREGQSHARVRSPIVVISDDESDDSDDGFPYDTEEEDSDDEANAYGYYYDQMHYQRHYRRRY